MVKLKGPGFGIAASGSLGDAITYSTSKGRAYVKKKPNPKQPRTGAQLSMRAMMKFLSQQWQNLNANQQTTWANAYPDPQLNNYNAFLRHNLERWRRKASPSKAYPATESGTHPTFITLAAAGGPRHVVLEMQANITIGDNWLFLLFHSDTAPPDPDFDKLIHCQRAEDLNPYKWTHTPLAAGTHYYVIISATDSGRTAGRVIDADSAVVT